MYEALSLSQIRETGQILRPRMGMCKKALETRARVLHHVADMARIERIREEVANGVLTDEDVRKKAQSGWKPVAVVWERELDAEGPGLTREVDVPYGDKVAADAAHLEVNEPEYQVLMLTMELIVLDYR